MSELVYSPPTSDVQIKPRRRKVIYVWVALAAAVAFALALVYLGQYVRILELNYAVARHRREVEKAHDENIGLKAELYRRRSIGEIDVLAHDKLGMRAPAPEQLILVEETP